MQMHWNIISFEILSVGFCRLPFFKNVSQWIRKIVVAIWGWRAGCPYCTNVDSIDNSLWPVSGLQSFQSAYYWLSSRPRWCQENTSTIRNFCPWKTRNGSKRVEPSRPTAEMWQNTYTVQNEPFQLSSRVRMWSTAVKCFTHFKMWCYRGCWVKAIRFTYVFSFFLSSYFRWGMGHDFEIVQHDSWRHASL